ncbi:unnamed protein product [Mytilus coruscus]|uniref:Uncharacterized protein n=1 Tax=Mytilus coruscus TaxID=42192 RepID=A0A6J8A1B6_MYTCO|nr:unnamed protein product [Mytilus coruscus]
MSAQWDRQVSVFTGLEHIESGTFRRLAHLEILDISYNRKLGLCGFTNVTHDLPFTSIKVFKAQYLACERGGSTLLFNNDIKPLLNTKLEELYIDRNNLDKTEEQITSFIPKSLRYISATDNRWIVGPYSYYDMLINLTNVKKIDLSFQNRHQMSQSVNSWKCDYGALVAEIACLCKRYPYKGNIHHLTFEPERSFNQKAKLDMANHSATIHSCVPYFYPSFQLVIVPRNIEEIIMESARVGYSIPPLYISTPSAKKLFLRNNQLYSFIGSMCNFTDLQFLDLSGNKATDILSADLMKSEWCMYEFNIALIERTVARQGQNMIIMLQLSRMDIKNIPTEIMYILKEDTYIEYPENEDDRGIFWEDFAESLDS